MAGGVARRLRGVAMALAVLGLVLPIGAPAWAVGSVYGMWSVSGATPNWTGSLTVPARGFPAADLRIISNTPQIPSGVTAYLDAATPFGQTFGSSQNLSYVNVPTGPLGTPSTFTMTFATPTPEGGGWGFALGDVDAESIQITATDPAGNPVPVTGLGVQDTFNYCEVMPRPGACTGTGPFTDVPVWDPATGTLSGSGTNTSGAAGWFRPTASLATLTLTMSVAVGSGVYQLWLAALTAQIGGTVTAAGEPAPPTTTVRLVRPDGTPVLDMGGLPIVTTTGPDGAYSFGEIAAGLYRVVIDPPAGYTVVGPASQSVDSTGGDVTGTGFTIFGPAASPSPTGTAPATPVPGDPGAPGGELPVTGPSVAGTVTVALALLTTGAIVGRLQRRRRAGG